MNFTEATQAMLNPAYYPMAFKPQSLWNEAEKSAFADDPNVIGDFGSRVG